MSINLPKTPPELWPNVDHLVTEDDTPVDNWYAEKQQRLFTEPLYSSWTGPGEGRRFVAAADVGLFHTVEEPPLVPDGMLSLDVELPQDLLLKGNRSYFIWKFGKNPEVVIEAVSNDEGDELGRKLETYEAWEIKYYVVWDPETIISDTPLQGFVLRKKKYRPLPKLWFPEVGLGLTLWQGAYEEKEAEWLRWCDQKGNVILTGKERADQEQKKAERLAVRAEQEQKKAEWLAGRAEQEHQRAERLAAQLRALGIDVPENGK